MSSTQQLILGEGAGGAPAAYQIQRSLRFNSADSAYLNRTPASAGNRRTWTWSAWVKRSAIGGTNPTLFSVQVDANNQDAIRFDTGNELRVFSYQSSAFVYSYKTSAVYRDPSAWYHIVVAIDTTNATSADRGIIYVNGQRITNLSLNTAPTQNADGLINTTNSHQIGRNATSEYFDGYITDVYFIDGSAKTPSDFGETDTDTGVWKPKAYSGSYGTNGFYLKFADNSGTTSTTLGKDSSGNGNNWTPNNFSVTAGAGNDSLVDTPTPYGTDTGAGGEVRGNYCTLNPLDTGTVTLANGNLDVTFGTIARGTRATFGVSSGKYYFEMTVGAFGSGGPAVGVAYANANITTNYAGSDANAWVYNGGDGKIYNNSSGTGSNATYTTNDVVGVAINMDSGTVTFYKNGSAQTSTVTGLSGTVFPVVTSGTTAGVQYFNFGQRPFAYTAPSGFKALCTQNLPTPTIGATATTRADDYFNTVLYTGTGSSLGVTGVGFQPDWVWIKERSGAADHGLYDAVRGVQKQLESNNTDAETTETTGLTAFNSDGFTVGALAQLNTNTDTYVAWNWKANGAGSSNNAGSIQSTVSASTASGFSVVTYTGTGVNATVGHGLGVAPVMIIVKCRNASGDIWDIYNKEIGPTKFLRFASNAAGTFNSWQDTNPTSSVFYISTDTVVNTNGNTYVAYCFAPIAGYSAFGSYTGNGSTDGPFMYTGFRPAWVLVKASSTTGDWLLYDNKRNAYNVVNNILYPNLSDAEATSGGGATLDFVSNGFKLRGAGAGFNDSGATFIYAAFAEFPFKYTLAR